MSRIRSFQTAVIFSLFVGLALATSAFARPGHGPGPHGRYFERQLEELALPAETRSAVQAVLDESKSGQDAQREQIRAAHESIRALLDQDKVDEAAVMEQADAIGALMTEKRKTHLRTLIRVRNLLTVEQRAALDQQLQERRADRHGKRCDRGGEQPSTAAPGDVQS